MCACERAFSDCSTLFRSFLDRSFVRLFAIVRFYPFTFPKEPFAAYTFSFDASILLTRPTRLARVSFLIS